MIFGISYAYIWILCELLSISTICCVTPPILPLRFYTDFKLFYTPRDDKQMPLPPWPAGYPSELPYIVGRGSTWYASDLQIAVEYYQDYCVPIFSPPPYFPCIIFNFQHTAYLITPEYTGLGSCCVYRENWSVPHRNFMVQFAKYFDKTTTDFGRDVLNQTINWWVIPQDASEKDPNHQVFGGYGWSEKSLVSGHKVPVDFWYEGEVGWAQQLFYNFTDTGQRIKDLDDFQLPKTCETKMACLYPVGHSRSQT